MEPRLVSDGAATGGADSAAMQIGVTSAAPPFEYTSIGELLTEPIEPDVWAGVAKIKNPHARAAARWLLLAPVAKGGARAATPDERAGCLSVVDDVVFKPLGEVFGKVWAWWSTKEGDDCDHQD